MYKWILPTISEVITASESNSVCHSQKAENGGINSVGVPPTDPRSKTEVDSNVYTSNVNTLKQAKVERQWRGAIAAVEQLLLESIGSKPCHKGLVLAGPVPVLSHPVLLSSLPTWIFTTEWLKLNPKKPGLLPPSTLSATENTRLIELEPYSAPLIPLLPSDPLAAEQFCLVLTASFSLVMVAGQDTDGFPVFMFTFEPEAVERAWRILRSRIELTSPKSLIDSLDTLVEKYYPIAPDYRTVTQFSRLLLLHLPEPEEARGAGREARGKKQEIEVPSQDTQELPLTPQRQLSQVGNERVDTERNSPLNASFLNGGKIRTEMAPPYPSHRPDLEFLQAFAHEVRTPLTTIRTLIRLLLKRRDLSGDVRKRLEVIEHECREQIDRMELMFRAAELETSKAQNTNTYLIATSLEQVLQQSIPRWQQSAKRRNLTIEVVMPHQMPTVISHPSQLDQVLTGMIENYTRSLPAGSHIQVQVMPAGDQLKLQLFSESQSKDSGAGSSFCVPPIRKSLGQLLTFQPETGSISLNLTATKHLFQAIGGKLIVRQRPHLGEVLTVFLPLEVSNQAHNYNYQ